MTCVIVRNTFEQMTNKYEHFVPFGMNECVYNTHIVV